MFLSGTTPACTLAGFYIPGFLLNNVQEFQKEENFARTKRRHPKMTPVYVVKAFLPPEGIPLRLLLRFAFRDNDNPFALPRGCILKIRGL